MSSSSVSIHGRIRAVRLQRELSIRHCARQMDWDESKWRRMESGNRPIYAEEILQIGAILNVSAGLLLGELDPLFADWTATREQAAAAHG